jgi:hypothetical protein
MKKKTKWIVLSIIILCVWIFIALFAKWNIDLGPILFISRSNKIIKEYIPQDFEVRKYINLIIAKDCQSFVKGTYDCKQIYRKSVWQNSSWDLFDVWTIFQNQKWKISISNLAVSPAESVVDTMEKINNGDWDDFEILVWSGSERIDGFFHG